MGRFVIKKTPTGAFNFSLYAVNSEKIAVSSQVYQSKPSCIKGINSIAKNAEKCIKEDRVEDQTLKKVAEKSCPKFEIYFDKAGLYRYRLIATNGESIAMSEEGYKSKSGCVNGIKSVAVNASGAEIVDETTDKKNTSAVPSAISVTLREATQGDLALLDGTTYGESDEKTKKQMLKDSEKGKTGGKYFKLYLIEDGEATVGVLNVCGHSQSVVSVAPEIKEEFKKREYAYLALSNCFEMLKSQGFALALADIRTDNTASKKLHEKLGFEYVRNYLSMNGNELMHYVKLL